MAKKQIEESNSNSIERKMLPTEWAKEDKIDQCLFLAWKDQLMIYQDYLKLKSTVYKEKKNNNMR